MKMIEMPFSYWNDLANQMIITSALLSGFSIAIVANLLVYNSDRRLIRIILKIATAAAGFFLISLFAIQSIAIKTSDSYPFELTHSAISIPKNYWRCRSYVGHYSPLFYNSTFGIY
jgi:hypothetical protein